MTPVIPSTARISTTSATPPPNRPIAIPIRESADREGGGQMLGGSEVDEPRIGEIGVGQEREPGSGRPRADV
ncbi:hypothetical protein [Acidipropionibacterium virtanenii]|nr:hypothetical protein [Acidipropionibacterium virtanenii]